MFSPNVIAAIQVDALARYPRESCGLVVEEGCGPRYLACDNLHEEPLTGFRLDPQQLLRAGASLRAIVHSHPDGPDHPTEQDMVGQIASSVPWGISVARPGHAEPPFWWGGGVPVPPLIGRQFRHGVADCYVLIRDVFRQCGVELPEVPRSWEWWLAENGAADLYRRGFANAGFAEIPFSSLQPGDVVLMAIKSAQPNHAALVLESGKILHHLAGRISGEDVLYRWRRFVTLCLRFRAERVVPI